MIVTNQTTSDIYFGPLHLGAGVGTTLTVDDTTAISLYLTNDSVADALNNAYNSGKVTVSSAADPFPRPTGDPSLLHGSGNPEGLVFAPQGSVYLRRDGVQTNGGVVYTKTSGVTLNTGWLNVATASGASVASPTGALVAFGGATAPSGWLICDGSAISRTTYSLLFAVVGSLYGAGDGSTTFNLPDLRGRVPLGYAASGGHADVSTLGNSDSVALANRRAKHHHTVNDAGHAHRGNVDANAGPGGITVAGKTGNAAEILESNPGQTVTTGITVGVSTTDPLDTPAYLVVNHIIKT